MSKAQFQSFDETADPTQGGPRVALLRAALARHGVDGFIVPRADEHQNEYVPACAERLAWLTGFTGSAGTAIVLRDSAAIFVDGRYTIQVVDQVDGTVLAPQSLIDNPPETWLSTHLKKGDRLGYDPWLHTPAQVERLDKAVTGAGATLVALDNNPIDAVWADRRAPHFGQIALYRDALAGRDVTGKLADIRGAMKDAAALLVSDPHAMAWTFNIRGDDVGHTPLPLGFALLPREGRPTLYLDGRKLSNSVRDALEALADIVEPTRLTGDLAALGAGGGVVMFDAATVPQKLKSAVTDAGGRAEMVADPIALMKAAKTQAERQGSRDAHRRDAAAVVRFLAWFDREAPKGGLTEIDAVEALESFRRDTGLLKDVSFPTIAGFGPHAAIPHYRVTTASNRSIGQGMFLIDSGAQYEDGTTDITRTVVVGDASVEMRDRFTRVLKGHIAIARSVFPQGVSGAQLDSFARQFLWQAGLDFDHGTGHGVGAYLSVHEGPQRIAKTGTVALVEGMILSNEPGYYKAGHWGIRIENLLLVESREISGAERPMLGFETLTFAPIDLKLVEAGLLTMEERTWLDAYHETVRAIVSPLVEPDVRSWLEHATRPLAEA
ncbi:aminopeptidase P family protein [Lichenihabitans psoromatis]|uniref:aminopeptidase P family protein n=1 Tax=Lichenihabitans psoromatis TaxID=2528642 RepID=UPI00103859FF|nr:aminopeptidase P family protein [Lichenihabitans psoromatis]